MKQLLISIITTFVLFSSCGEDTVINKGSPSGTVFYSLDSLSIWLGPGTMGGGASILHQQAIELSKIKVEYKIQTNVDSLHSEAWLIDSSVVSNSYDSSYHVINQHFYWNTDSLITYTFNFPIQQIYLYLNVSLYIYIIV